MVRVYADFNRQDESGVVWLDVRQSRLDLAQARVPLTPGMRVLLYTNDGEDLELEGVLVWHRDAASWGAVWHGTDAMGGSTVWRQTPWSDDSNGLNQSTSR